MSTYVSEGQRFGCFLRAASRAGYKALDTATKAAMDTADRVTRDLEGKLGRVEERGPWARALARSGEVAVEGARGAALAALGVGHGTLGMGLGAVNLAGDADLVLTDAGARREAARRLSQLEADPVGAVRRLGTRTLDFFEAHPAFTAGDYASIPVAGALVGAALGRAAAVLMMAGGFVAALGSPDLGIIPDRP